MAANGASGNPSHKLMLVLDTNHITVLGYASPAAMKLLRRLDASSEEAVTTVITLEEQMRGWLAEIHRIKDVAEQPFAYDRLKTRAEFMAKWVMLPWDAEAASRFAELRAQGVRIGTMDLKIASITIAHDAILLTRNISDFSKVPGLRVENWLV